MTRQPTEFWSIEICKSSLNESEKKKTEIRDTEFVQYIKKNEERRMGERKREWIQYPLTSFMSMMSSWLIYMYRFFFCILEYDYTHPFDHELFIIGGYKPVSCFIFHTLSMKIRYKICRWMFIADNKSKTDHFSYRYMCIYVSFDSLTDSYRIHWSNLAWGPYMFNDESCDTSKNNRRRA